MIDILLGIIWLFVMVIIIVVLIVVLITLVGWVIIKFFEFWKGEEGDDYRK